MSQGKQINSQQNAARDHKKNTCSKLGMHSGETDSMLFLQEIFWLFPLHPRKPGLSIWLIAVRWPYIHNVVMIFHAYRAHYSFQSTLLDIVFWGSLSCEVNYLNAWIRKWWRREDRQLWVRVKSYWVVLQAPGLPTSRPVFFLWSSSERNSPSPPPKHAGRYISFLRCYLYHVKEGSILK